MPNSIKYTTSTETKALRKGNFYIAIGDDPKAPTSQNGYWVGYDVPPGGYVTYINKESGGPSIYTSANDSDLINLINTISGQSHTTISQALDWVATQNDVMVVNKQYPTIVTDGLVLNLDAGYLPSYPGTSSTWYDLGTYSNNGTLTNGPIFNSNGGINFDGVDDYIEITSIQPTFFTLSSWFKGTGTASLGTSGGLISQPTSTISYYLFYDWVNQTTGLLVGANSGSLSVPNILRDTIHNVVGVYNGQQRLIYINGHLEGSQNWTTNPDYSSAVNTQIGRLGYPSFSRNFNGSIYKTLIYDRVLTSKEILQNYHQAPIVTDGLVFAVDAGNLVSYESGSTTTYQLTGTVSSGSLNNGVTFSPNSGGTWGFDGSDDFINFGNSAPINFIYTDPFSLEAWLNPNALSDFKHIIGKTFGNYRLAQNGNAVSFRLDSNKMIFQTSAILTVGKWTHVIATWEPSTFTGRIYIDGNLAATSTNTNINWTSTTANFQIGNSPGENYYFNGSISLGRVYNRTLNSDEIIQNFKAQRSRFGI
jgi:hypothetical protein